MGYTHYWYTPTELPKKEWKLFAADCKKIFAAAAAMDLILANGSGDPDTHPQITPEFISFNGSEKQPTGIWTTTEDITIPWPSELAGIIGENPDPISEKREGTWFAGDLLTQRTAPIRNETGYGSGSYETCSFNRRGEIQDWQKEDGKNLRFDCCKTGYRPYDIIVTACLIALKFRLKDSVKVSTDGEEKDWMDGRILCFNELGYGMELNIFEE